MVAPMEGVLERIVAAHRRTAAHDHRRLDDLIASAMAAPQPRDFRGALVAGVGVSVIAEIKRRSPSAGRLAPTLDPGAIALAYQDGGAVALSVLTDTEYFGGSASDLAAARNACGLPALRKDFTVAEADICDARVMGADAVLLIVAALSNDELTRFGQLASDLHLAALVEVHDKAELDRALETGADLIGVNQRDLATFEIDRGRAAGVGEAIPDGVVKVAESGIRNRDDLMALDSVGYDAVLVGETLVTAAEPAEAVRSLRGA